MESFEKHPTWRMLEAGMKSLKVLRENTESAQVAAIAHEAMCSLYSIQLEVEDKLIGGEEQDE